MIVQVFPSGPFETNAYVAGCSATRQAALIDPAPDSFDKVQKYLNQHQLVPIKILLTHSHWDHIADIKKFQDAYSIPVYVHPLDAPNVRKPGADMLPTWLDIPGIEPDVLIEDGDSISVGQLNFQVLHTPGHSSGCVCFYEPSQHILFSGDTLFKGTIGNLSFPTSKPDFMWPSLERLSHLPLETKIYPGHGPETTISQESSWLKNAKNLFG